MSRRVRNTIMIIALGVLCLSVTLIVLLFCRPGFVLPILLRTGLAKTKDGIKIVHYDIIYDEESNNVYSEGYYYAFGYNHILHGEWLRYHPDGRFAAIKTYVDNKVWSGKYYSPEGELLSEVREGTGKITEYYDGRITEEVEMVDGVETGGYWQGFYPNGDKEIYFDLGTGEYTDWYENGQIKSKGAYNTRWNEPKIGRWVYYGEDGTKRKEEFYSGKNWDAPDGSVIEYDEKGRKETEWIDDNINDFFEKTGWELMYKEGKLLKKKLIVDDDVMAIWDYSGEKVIERLLPDVEIVPYKDSVMERIFSAKEERIETIQETLRKEIGPDIKEVLRGILESEKIETE